MRVKFFFALALVCVTALPAAAQHSSPAEADVQAAIATGLKGKGRDHSLDLQDSGKSFINAMAAAGSDGRRSGGSGNGFSVNIYTPLSWITQQAANAAKEYRSFSIENVTDDMREPVLRVIVNPDTPSIVTAEGMKGTQSAQHVVLRDESKKIVIQPISKDAFTTEAANAMGGKAVYQGVQAIFPLEALKELRGPNGDREFFVTVVGENGERDFKIKKKHFGRLP